MASSRQLTKIPIFDLSEKSLNPSSSAWLPTCNNVRQALEELGIFLATYEKVSLELDKQVFHALEEVFNLPLETKTKNILDWPFYGYRGQLPHAPLHESLGFPEATTLDAVQSFTNLMWPSGNKDFCENMLCYARLVSELEQLVDRMVFESYGAEKHYDSHVGSSTYNLRVIKYSVPEANEEINRVGANAHTDKNFLTILYQNQVNGLQIQLRNGEWLDVDVPPRSFIVMAGDAYEAWSNGRIKSAKHQVIMKANKPRYCLGLFSYNHGTINIPEEVVDSEHPLRFKPFDNFGLLRFYLSGASSMTDSTAEAYCGVIA